jgi:hypothetical protein
MLRLRLGLSEPSFQYKEESTAFLKKRSKKLLDIALSLSGGLRLWNKSFLVLFSKKNILPF